MSDDWVVVPGAALSQAALHGLIEQFVLREGTEYGARDYTLEEKVARVRQQLDTGKVVIIFSEALGVAEIVPSRDLPGNQPAT